MCDLLRSDDLLEEARQTRDEFAASLVGLGVPGELVLTGSASVPGALTKGDIDLHLRVAEEQFEAAVARLRLAYPVGSPQSWARTLAVFDVPGSRPTGLAVTPIGSEHDRRFTRAWEALGSEPELLEQYNLLKLSSTGPDDYELRKSDFFTAIGNAPDGTPGRRQGRIGVGRSPSRHHDEEPTMTQSPAPTPAEQPDDTTAAVTDVFTEDEHATLRSAAMLAGAWVSRAEKGMFDSIKESFAASKAIASSPPEVAALVAKGGFPELPKGGAEQAEARALDLLRQAVGILRAKAPNLVDGYRTMVLQSCRDAAAAADDTSERESAVIGKVEAALA